MIPSSSSTPRSGVTSSSPAPHGGVTSHCRFARHTAERLGCTFEILDDGSGCVFRIARGGRSFVSGGGPVCPYPINTSTAVTIARDKVFTNELLTRAGLPHLGGKCFSLTPEGRKFRGDGYELDDAHAYAQTLGYPIFCKPIAGSHGDFAELVSSPADLDRYAERASSRHRSIVIQRFFHGTELRVFVIDEQVVFCIEKHLAALAGDGTLTVAELLASRNAELHAAGISAYPLESTPVKLDGRLLDRSEVMRAGAKAEIVGRRNVSVGADIRLIEPVPDELAALARSAARAIGLRVAGVDVLCGGLAGTDEYALHIVEVNGSPEITSLEKLGRWDLIEKLWTTLIEEALR